jgi:ABC-type amino acid transport substrate-binding protein
MPDTTLSAEQPTPEPESLPSAASAVPPTPEATPTPPATAAPPATPPIETPETPRHNTNRWWLAAVILVALAVLVAAGWYIFQSFNNRVNTDHADHMEMSPSVHQIMHVRQKLIIGTEDTYEPMEFLDPKSHDRVGFDIDLGKAIAQELNVPAEFTNINFDSIFAPQNLGKDNVLTTGKVDLLIDSVTITPERQKYYLFSDPYINVGQVAITLKSNTTIKTKADLTNQKLAVAPATSNEALAKTLTTDAKVLRYVVPEDQAMAVVNGKADAMLVDLTNAKGIINNHPKLKIATDPFTEENYGVVIAKGKEDLQSTINQILDTLKQHGILESLRQKWFE